MNLKLLSFKNYYRGDTDKGHYVRLAVVDLDKSKDYPANYICLLPMDARANGKAKSNFSKLFGNDSPELAKSLLTKALKTEEDAEIKTEIEKRFELLER